MAAALQNGGGKAGKVADNASAQRQNMIAPLHFLCQQPVHRGGQVLPALGGFARWQNAPQRLFTGPCQRGFHHAPPGGMNMGVGDDGHARFAQARTALPGDIGQQTSADPHLVGPSGDIDGDGGHGCGSVADGVAALGDKAASGKWVSSQWVSSSSTRASVRAWGTLPLVTWMGACA